MVVPKNDHRESFFVSSFISQGCMKGKADPCARRAVLKINYMRNSAFP